MVKAQAELQLSMRLGVALANCLITYVHAFLFFNALHRYEIARCLSTFGG